MQSRSRDACLIPQVRDSEEQTAGGPHRYLPVFISSFSCREVNAAPLLRQIAQALRGAALEAILIGNAGAAMHGAPVTTVDFDFMFRSTPKNLEKLKVFSKHLDAVILRPYYPVSALFRVMNDDRGLQVDFMPVVHGVKSFNSLRSRAERLDFEGNPLWIASLEDIIGSKRAAGRERDLAVLPILERTLRERTKETR